MVGDGDHLEVWDRRTAGSEQQDALDARSTRSRRALAILLDMTRTHVPVLAGELIEPSRSAAGGDRGRLHLRCGRPRAPGRGPHRADRDARLHRPRSGRRGALRRVRSRGRLRDPLPAMEFADGLALLSEEGLEADVAYLDLGDLVDAAGRMGAGLLLQLRRAARHAHGPDQELDAREVEQYVVSETYCSKCSAPNASSMSVGSSLNHASESWVA